ncbi:MAG: mechanosensitive ion channel, partial [Clostridia bacterium]|nr:mechanosensitive ion channel [Clostridia bacterium]
ITNFFTGNVWNIVGFFAAFVFGWLLIKLVMRIIRKIFSRSKIEKIAQNFLLTIIKFCLYLIWIIALLAIIGVEISGIVTALSAVVLAIGLALEDLIANVAYGIVIVSYKMFKKGDFIEVDGVSGSVEEINFLFTTITTTDNKKITLPNSTVVGNSVTNYGGNSTRRVDFTFSVAYESDVEKVKKIVTDVMESDGRVLLEPKKPFCRLKTLNASSLDFFANCWCDKGDYWDVYYYVVENVYNEFKRNGISVPFTQTEVRMRTDEVVMPVIGDGIPPRVEKQREEQKKTFDLENDDLTEYFDEKRAEYADKKEQRRAEKARKKAEKKGETEEEPVKELHSGASEEEDGEDIGTEQI